jgi:hypothetical protein
VAEPLPRRTNWGPRGCLIALALVAALALLLETLYGWIDRRSPGTERIEAMTNRLVRLQLADEPVVALTVAAIHARRKRFTWAADRWAVEGAVILDEGTPESRPRVPYVAVVHTVCDDHLDRACWVIEQLTYGERIIKLRPAPGSVIN